MESKEKQAKQRLNLYLPEDVKDWLKSKALHDRRTMNNTAVIILIKEMQKATQNHTNPK